MTLRFPEGFARKPPAGFDGLFDWEWTKGCFGIDKHDPMDFDGVLERWGQFLIFETKDVGVAVPKGQMTTLTALHGVGRFSIMFIWGKQLPVHGEIWFAGSKHRRDFVGVDGARELVSRWYSWANSRRCP